MVAEPFLLMFLVLILHAGARESERIVYYFSLPMEVPCDFYHDLAYGGKSAPSFSHVLSGEERYSICQGMGHLIDLSRIHAYRMDDLAHLFFSSVCGTAEKMGAVVRLAEYFQLKDRKALYLTMMQEAVLSNNTGLEAEFLHLPDTLLRPVMEAFVESYADKAFDNWSEMILPNESYDIISFLFGEYMSQGVCERVRSVIGDFSRYEIVVLPRDISRTYTSAALGYLIVTEDIHDIPSWLKTARIRNIRLLCKNPPVFFVTSEVEVEKLCLEGSAGEHGYNFGALKIRAGQLKLSYLSEVPPVLGYARSLKIASCDGLSFGTDDLSHLRRLEIVSFGDMIDISKCRLEVEELVLKVFAESLKLPEQVPDGLRHLEIAHVTKDGTHTSIDLSKWDLSMVDVLILEGGNILVSDSIFRGSYILLKLSHDLVVFTGRASRALRAECLHLSNFAKDIYIKVSDARRALAMSNCRTVFIEYPAFPSLEYFYSFKTGYRITRMNAMGCIKRPKYYVSYFSKRVGLGVFEESEHGVFVEISLA
jgi:hypothetical protein